MIASINLQRLMLIVAAALLFATTANAFSQEEEITVGAQQEFDISLSSNPSTGYQWMVKEIADESVVRFVNSTFVSSGNNVPGEGGTEVLTFFAEKEGSTTITLEYLRSWEPDSPAETRVISVTVTPDSMATMPGPLYLVGQTSPGGKYNVTVLWFSNEIGEENEFSIRVFDTESNEEVYDNLSLDFIIMQDDQVLVSKHITEPHSPESAYGDSFAFESEGNYLLRIGNINESSESVEFPVQVTPEFGPIVLLVTIVALAGATAAGTFAKRWL